MLNLSLADAAVSRSYKISLLLCRFISFNSHFPTTRF